MDDFKVGDVVVLKGHENPKMVIEHISQKSEGKEAVCKWFNNSGEGAFMNMGNFILEILKKTE